MFKPAIALFAFIPALTVPARAGGLTFFALSDLHYGNDLPGHEANRAALIDALNALPGKAYPLSAGGGFVDKPRGVLIPGDLVDKPDPALWRRYLEGFGVNGEGRLRFPVYDGLGNHEEPGVSGGVLPLFLRRNAEREGLTGLDSLGYHYSWDWEGIHFVNLNLCAGSDQGHGIGHPLGAVDFLRRDLEKNVGWSGRPVFVMQHYPFDAAGFWWHASEKERAHAVLRGYNVIGLLHGHTHAPRFYVWQGFDVFDDGTAMAGEALVFRITAGRLVAVALSQGRWGQVRDKPISMGSAALWRGGNVPGLRSRGLLHPEWLRGRRPPALPLRRGP